MVRLVEACDQRSAVLLVGSLVSSDLQHSEERRPGQMSLTKGRANTDGSHDLTHKRQVYDSGGGAPLAPFFAAGG